MILTYLLACIVLFSPIWINFNVVCTIFHYLGVFVIIISAIKSILSFLNQLLAYR